MANGWILYESKERGTLPLTRAATVQSLAYQQPPLRRREAGKSAASAVFNEITAVHMPDFLSEFPDSRRLPVYKCIAADLGYRKGKAMMKSLIFVVKVIFVLTLYGRDYWNVVLHSTVRGTSGVNNSNIPIGGCGVIAWPWKPSLAGLSIPEDVFGSSKA
ncbi:hypothetical protein IF2G_09334 [Cordyceps javanica]|nr:hypothetical protein IF2G_09334 [Cordyceps javanica]